MSPVATYITPRLGSSVGDAHTPTPEGPSCKSGDERVRAGAVGSGARDEGGQLRRRDRLLSQRIRRALELSENAAECAFLHRRLAEVEYGI